MYYITEDNSLHVTKGDDVYFEIHIDTDGGEEYELANQDHLHLTVRYMPVSLGEEYEEPLLEIDSFSKIIHIPHEALRELEVGQYSADIQLCQDRQVYSGDFDKDYDIFTVWPIHENLKKCGKLYNFKNFVVDPEVSTHHR